MRTCLFCHGPAGNAEHVVAKWLFKAMDRPDEEVSSFVSIGNEILRQRPPVPFKKLTIKKVCQKCNNGWMSDLESRFKLKFAHLVRPRAFDDAATVETLMGSHRDLLIQWLLKSAVIAEHAMPRAESPIIPQRLSKVRDIDIEAQGFHILAAEIFNPGFSIQLRKGYRTYNAGSFHENQIHKDGFNFSIQLNHLALMLINAPGAFVGAKSPYEIDGCNVMPLMPERKIDWEMPVKHLFGEFEHFIDSLEVYATKPQ